jgi:hypothetical protein
LQAAFKFSIAKAEQRKNPEIAGVQLRSKYWGIFHEVWEQGTGGG